mmetsp:Transcript_2675/g.8773  ORF Transcript_2675/g.8773 Transcript_2675/m.8773 type:complete len:263 (-) Transcript_2675:752-1540(-)
MSHSLKTLWSVSASEMTPFGQPSSGSSMSSRFSSSNLKCAGADALRTRKTLRHTSSDASLRSRMAKQASSVAPLSVAMVTCHGTDHASPCFAATAAHASPCPRFAAFASASRCTAICAFSCWSALRLTAASCSAFVFFLRASSSASNCLRLRIILSHFFVSASSMLSTLRSSDATTSRAASHSSSAFARAASPTAPSLSMSRAISVLRADATLMLPAAETFATALTFLSSITSDLMVAIILFQSFSDSALCSDTYAMNCAWQ